MAVRIKSEPGRILMIWWCMFTFITSGYEHSVANMCGLLLGLLPVVLFGAVAPLVAPEPLTPGVVAGEGAGVAAGAWGAAPLSGVLGCTAAGVGGAAGVAGVPKVEGVHAHVRLAPTTVARPAKIATEMNRVCLRT